MKKAKVRKSKNTKSTKRKNPTKSVVMRPGVTAIIPYSEIVKPETYQGKFTLVPTVFNEAQIRSIIAPTPANMIKQRPGKGGGTWDYVPGWWFRKKLNFTFGFSHDFKILGERVDGEYITVKGEITVRHPKSGQVIAVKGDYGGAQIKFKKNEKHTPENYLDIANDFKAASTDCFKRCSVQFGFAGDVYGKNESTAEGFSVPQNAPPAPKPVATEVKEPIRYECHECADFVSEQEYTFSKKAFGKPYCRACQNNLKKS